MCANEDNSSAQITSAFKPKRPNEYANKKTKAIRNIDDVRARSGLLSDCVSFINNIAQAISRTRIVLMRDEPSRVGGRNYGRF